MAETESPQAETKPFLRRGEDFESLYANWVYFQPSEWDVRTFFGEVDNDPDGNAFIALHTSVALPWLQAKLAHYYLTLQLAIYEMKHGQIAIPDLVRPPEPDKPEGILEGDPYAIKVYEFVKKIREEFLSQSGRFSY